MNIPPIDIFEPDKNRLDDELQYQPKLCRIWNQKLAVAQKRLDKAKAHLKFVHADLFNKIRINYKDHGFSKSPGEAAINHVVFTQKRYRDAQDELIEAQYIVNQLEGISTSIDHRKKSLEGLLWLFGQDYWADPRISGDGRRLAKDQKLDKVFGRRQR